MQQNLPFPQPNLKKGGNEHKCETDLARYTFQMFKRKGQLSCHSNCKFA